MECAGSLDFPACDDNVVMKEFKGRKQEHGIKCLCAELVGCL